MYAFCLHIHDAHENELDGSLRDDLQYNIWNVIRLFMTIGLLLNTEIKFSTHDAFLE